jgi:hypothetical protein
MEVDREKLRLKDNEQTISPPYLEPAWQCGTAVVVRGFVAHATLDLEIDGTIVVTGFPGGFPGPDGCRIPLAAALTAGQKLRARQTFNGVTSDWSAMVIAVDYKTQFPAGPPRPQINPEPVFKCGRRTGVANLLVGCDVWIEADAVEVGKVKGAKAHQGVNVSPAYDLGDHVIARASICGDRSPPSETKIAQAGPSPLPAPGFLPVYENSEQATVTNVVNGATLTLLRNGVVQFSFTSWGYQHLVGLAPPLTAGETLSCTQQLCPGDPPSPPGDVPVQPCSALPAPGVEPVQAGDTEVRLTSFVSDARIKVFVNLVKTGDGSGPVVPLTAPVPNGATIHVLQQLKTCISSKVQEVKAQCVAPPANGNSAWLDLFPVGTMDYDGGMVTVTSGHKHVIAGTIYYPAEGDGPGTPFNVNLAKLGRVPIAVLVHGRHGGTDSHLGYDYLQHQLARMGIVAISVDCNESDQWGGWADNIRDRADIIIASIAHMQALDGSDPILKGRIDFKRLALMGHSRGGDAVVTVPEIISLAGVTIRGVISLAPVNSGASSGHPKGYPLMAILPAHDGDVKDLNGAQFYDAADPAPFKSQLFVHFANHNYFNRRWTNDDTNGGLPLMARADHERILSAYGCAFFRTVLLGQDHLPYLEGRVRPVGVATGNVQLSFKREKAVTVDDHQQANGIGKNSMAGPTTQTGLSANEFPFTQGGGAFNISFFGNTIGMVAEPKRTGTFRSQLDTRRDLGKKEVWVRAAEVYAASVPVGATGFLLGLEDETGAIAWVDSDGVGGVPRPQDRRAFDLAKYGVDKSKTMPRTFRFPASCFNTQDGRFDIKRIVAVLLSLNRGDKRALAFDDLQIVG